MNDYNAIQTSNLKLIIKPKEKSQFPIHQKQRIISNEPQI